jgi:hypothetical protein
LVAANVQQMSVLTEIQALARGGIPDSGRSGYNRDRQKRAHRRGLPLAFWLTSDYPPPPFAARSSESVTVSRALSAPRHAPKMAKVELILKVVRSPCQMLKALVRAARYHTITHKSVHIGRSGAYTPPFEPLAGIATACDQAVTASLDALLAEMRVMV